MQTFLPFADFEQSARSLDWRRLGKQRSENIQLLQAMTGYKLRTSVKVHNPLAGMRTMPLPESGWTLKKDAVGWTNHPCKRMWMGFEYLFRQYHVAICEEWTRRGYNDTCAYKFDYIWFRIFEDEPDDDVPHWLGDNMFHISYQSLLIRKDPDFYLPIFPGAPENLEFKFPV